MSTKDNYSKAFGKGAKGRTNFLVVGVLAVIVAAGAALMTKKDAAGSGAAASVMAAPEGKTTVSPDKASDAYLQTLRQSNKEEVAKAEQQGGSAVAVLTNKTTKVDEENKEPAAPVVLTAPTAPLPQFVPPQGSSVAMGQQVPQYGPSQTPAQQQKNPAITNQVAELLGTWAAPGQSIYVAPVSQQAASAASGAPSSSPVQSAAAVSSERQDPVVLIPAGRILSGVLETEVNSDDGGPVLAQVVVGPYKGARLLGSMRLGVDKVVLTFDKMSFKGRTVAVSAVAMEPSVGRTGLADEVDRRWFQKYGMLFLSAFVAGYGEAASQVAEVQNATDAGTVVSKEKLSSRDRAIVALGKSGTAVAQQMQQLSAQVKTMVKVNQGSPIAILFLSDLTAAE